MTNQEAFTKLSDQTYIVEHCPNCPKPFLVRLMRKGMGEVGTPHDIRGYGNNFGEAASDALQKQEITPRVSHREIVGLNQSWLDQK